MPMSFRVRLARSAKGFSLGKPKVGPEVFEAEGVQGFFDLPRKIGNVSGPSPVGPPVI